MVPSFGAVCAAEGDRGGDVCDRHIDVWLSVSVAPSESVALKLTVELAGPSGKLHWKLEPSSEPATKSPSAPQLMDLV